MASTIKVDNVQNQPGTNIINKCGSAITVGAGSDTTTVPGAATVTGNLSGAEITSSSNVVKSNAFQAADAGNIISQSGTDITVGASGDTIALASGASQTGFGRTGTVDWDTTPKTATFTAASGTGYFCNTSGGAFTCNLPAGSAGAIVSLADYTDSWNTDNVTVTPNGSEKINGVAASATLSTQGQSVTFVYVDSTEGWKNVQDSTSAVTGRSYITATVSGACNTLTTVDTDYKVAKFVGPGTFCVSTVSSVSPENVVSYMVVAGGGNGGQVDGNNGGGAGGGGGYREVISPSAPYTGSPLNGYPTPANLITLTATGYPITVGGGGANPSTFSTTTSAGGANGNSGSGGSGSGGSPISTPAGAGNTPPTTPPQGNNGGTSIPHSGQPFANRSGGGGGGAGGTGGAGSAGSGGTPGSATPSQITGAGVSYSQGGKGSCGNTSSGPDIGAVNTGNGNGGKQTPAVTRNGSSGIVVIRYKFQ
jgi:hypothetical protein